MIVKSIDEFALFTGQYQLIRANLPVTVIRENLPELPTIIKLSGRICLLISGYVFQKPLLTAKTDISKTVF